MKKLLLILIISLLTTTFAEGREGWGNQPCSGKKGGVARCRSDGKFICKNRSISKSKKRCGGRSKTQKPIKKSKRSAK